MNPKKCANLENCPKIDMVLDKDMLSWHYAASIRAVCGKCKEGVTQVVREDNMVDKSA